MEERERGRVGPGLPLRYQHLREKCRKQGGQSGGQIQATSMCPRILVHLYIVICFYNYRKDLLDLCVSRCFTKAEFSRDINWCMENKFDIEI